MSDAARILMTEGDAPIAPSTGQNALYTKTDHLFYSKGSDGVERPLKGDTGEGLNDLNALSTAENDVLVGAPTPFGSWVKKTVAEFKTILGLGSAAYTASTAYDVSGAAAGVIVASISDSDVTHCPDGNSVFDALAGKQAVGLSPLQSQATAENDFLVGAATPFGSWVKKTLAETKTVLGLGSAAYTDSTAYDPAGTAAGKIAASISDSDLTHAPDGNSVFDALALKAPLSGAALTSATINALTPTALATGFTIAGGTTSKTLTVPLDASVSGTNTGDQTGGTPALTLGTANTAGSSADFIRRDDTILAFDTTNPAALGTAAPGSATVAARRDHVHTNPTLSTALTGYTSGAGTVAAADTVLQAIQKLNGNYVSGVNTAQPAFLVNLSGEASNVTGDNTAYTIAFNTIIKDQTNNFNTGTYSFTAPISGYYNLVGYITMYSLAANNYQVELAMVTTGKIYYALDNYPSAVNPLADKTLMIAVPRAWMSANDTAYVRLTIGPSGSTKGVDIASYSFFSGGLEC